MSKDYNIYKAEHGTYRVDVYPYRNGRVVDTIIDTYILTTELAEALAKKLDTTVDNFEDVWYADKVIKNALFPKVRKEN